MANTTITPVKLTDVNVISPALTYSAVSATTDKFLIDCANTADNKLVIEFNASAADAAVKVLAGNGIQGVNDLTLSVPKGFSRIQLDSGAYMNVSGENKGKIAVSVGATTTTLGALALR